LDDEQVKCFIWDSLCNDLQLKSLVETKRKFVIEKIDPYQNPSKYIGGLNLLARAEKLPEDVRNMQKEKIGSLQ
jgi:hypothetical protein